jgi:hypothetical protein
MRGAPLLLTVAPLGLACAPVAIRGRSISDPVDSPNGIVAMARAGEIVVFTEDEHLVVTGHGDGRMRLWQADSGRFQAVSPA